MAVDYHPFCDGKGVSHVVSMIHNGTQRTQITIAPDECDFRTGIRVVKRLERVCALVLIACGLRRLVASGAGT